MLRTALRAGRPLTSTLTRNFRTTTAARADIIGIDLGTTNSCVAMMEVSFYLSLPSSSFSHEKISLHYVIFHRYIFLYDTYDRYGTLIISPMYGIYDFSLSRKEWYRNGYSS